MTELLNRALQPDRALRSVLPWLAASVAALWSLVAGLAVLSLLPLVVWVGEGAAAPLPDVLTIGAAIWLAAHRIPLDVGAGTWALSPLALTAIPVLLLHRAGRWAARTGGVSALRAMAGLAATSGAVYGVGAATVTLLTGTGHAPVALAVGFLAGGLVAALGLLAESGGRDRLLARLPGSVRVAAAGAAGAVLTLVAGGAALLVVALLAQAGRVAAIGEALDPGLPGGLVLGVVGAALVPNAALWAASFALGPGFAVGAGSTFSPVAVEPGVVPALPLLGALPEEALGSPGWLGLVIPLAAGTVAGAVVTRRSRASSAWRLAAEAAGAGAAAALTAAALALLSGGSAGSGRLSVVGPPVGAVAVWALAEIGSLAVGAALVMRFGDRRGWIHRSAGLRES